MGELRVFVAVLEHRSFRKAAAALHVTQPAVTKAIAGMEGVLEVKLFDRKAGGVEPTAHGLSFAPHAIAIFNELRSAAQGLAIVSSGVKGTLHIGTVPMPGVAFLPIAIRNLVAAHPDIFVSVVEARELDLAERLRKREIELAIFRSALFDSGDDLHVEALFEERLCVLASKDHPLAARQTGHMAGIARTSLGAASGGLVLLPSRPPLSRSAWPCASAACRRIDFDRISVQHGAARLDAVVWSAVAVHVLAAQELCWSGCRSTCPPSRGPSAPQR